MIFASRKINFIHVPKAAGSSVGKILRSTIRLTDEDKKLQDEFRKYCESKDVRFPNHATAMQRRDFLGEEEYKKYYSFAFVRNPFDLVVSLYEYTRQTEKQIFIEKAIPFNDFQKAILENTFSDWVMNFNLGKQQCQFVSDEHGNLIVDFVGRSEKIDYDMSIVLSNLGIEHDKPVDRTNKTKHKSYEHYYTPTLVDKVTKHFRDDLDRFNYQFSESALNGTA